MTQNYNNYKNHQNPNNKNPMQTIALIILATIAIFGYQIRGVIKPHFNTADKNIENSSIQEKNDYSITDLEEIELTDEDSDDDTKTSTKNDFSLVNSSNNPNGNYLHNAIDSSGQIHKWTKKGIAVWVENSSYQTTIYQAFAKYNKTFPELFKFMITQDRKKADITVTMVNILEHSNSGEYYKQGSTNLNYNQKGEINTANISLLPLDNKGNYISKSQMYSVILHEIGHAVGITGHSQDKHDVMYGFRSSSEFSTKDIETIRLMYSKNKEEVSSAKIGFESSKLQEALSYARKLPNKTTSWIQLGQVYYDLGQLNEALEAYKKALTIDPTDSDVYRSMAQCYYMSKKYETAIKYFKYAKQYSNNDIDTSLIDENIGICYHKLNQFNEAYPYLKSAFEANPKIKGNLYNFISVCANLDKKEDAKIAIEKYKNAGNDISNDEMIQVALKWIK